MQKAKPQKEPNELSPHPPQQRARYGTLLLDQRKELLPRLSLIPETSKHARSDGRRSRFLNTSHRHAHVSERASRDEKRKTKGTDDQFSYRTARKLLEVEKGREHRG